VGQVVSGKGVWRIESESVFTRLAEPILECLWTVIDGRNGQMDSDQGSVSGMGNLRISILGKLS